MPIPPKFTSTPPTVGISGIFNLKPALQPFDTWQKYPPTDEDEARIRKNNINLALYKGDFSSLKRLNLARIDCSPIVGINLFQTVADEFAKALFSEDLKIVVPSEIQPTVDELIQTTSLQSKLIIATATLTSVGGTILKTWRDTRNVVHIDVVPNNIYFCSHDPDDETLITGHTIAWPRANEKNETFIVREIHTPGKVTKEVLDNNFKPSQEQYDLWYPDNPSVVEHNYDGMLVEYIPNLRIDNQYFGMSDFDKFKDIVEEIIVRMSCVADILDKHARPTKVLPDELLDQVKELLTKYRNEMARTGLITKMDADFITGSNNVPRNLDVMYVPSDKDSGNLPRMFTWNANLEGAMSEIDKLFDLFLSLSCMTPEVFGTVKFSVAESGRALKFRNMRVLAESNRKRQMILPALKRILRGALFLAGKSVSLNDISVVIQDGLPFDELEATQVSAIWQASGLATRASAIINARPDITREQAEEEVTEIEEKLLVFGDDSTTVDKQIAQSTVVTSTNRSNTAAVLKNT